MQGSKHHIVAIVEYVLRSVAMMEVDVQHRDTFSTLSQCMLRGNGRVIEVAVASHVFTSSVVSGWTTQGKGAVVAFVDQRQSSECNVRAGFDGLPGGRGDRRAGIHGKETELAVNERGDMFIGQVAHRPDQGKGVVLPAGCRPFGPRGFQKGDIALTVCIDVARPVKRSRDDDIAEPNVLDSVANGIRSAWLFERRFENAVL